MCGIKAMIPKIHPSFETQFTSLRRRKIINVKFVEHAGEVFFEFHIGDLRLCCQYDEQYGESEIYILGGNKPERIDVIDTRFAEIFDDFENETVVLSRCSCRDGTLYFELQIKGQRLCWSVDYGNQGGRCFLMNENAVDGAGIFPIS